MKQNERVGYGNEGDLYHIYLICLVMIRMKHKQTGAVRFDRINLRIQPRIQDDCSSLMDFTIKENNGISQMIYCIPSDN